MALQDGIGSSSGTIPPAPHNLERMHKQSLIESALYFLRKNIFIDMSSLGWSNLSREGITGAVEIQALKPGWSSSF